MIALGSGDRTRTDDLWVMSPTSYHCSTPHYILIRFSKEEKKAPMKGLLKKIGRRLTLPPVKAVPSALSSLTSLFGMGRGGPRRYSHLKTLIY